MSNENQQEGGKFSFRWGIDLFDDAHTDIPNMVIDFYYLVPWFDTEQGVWGRGISNTEFTFIIHLARFKFESERGKASPSLTHTIRRRMGYKSNQGIINVEQGLEAKGLLKVERTAGTRSVYDFSELSKRVLRIAMIRHSKRNSDSVDIKSEKKWSSFVDGFSFEEWSSFVDGFLGDSSSFLDGSGQQNLTLRIKEEEKPKEEKKYRDKIDFSLGGCPHTDLADSYVFIDLGGDDLAKVAVKKVTPKRLKVLVENEGVKTLTPEKDEIYYANGSGKLRPVLMGAYQDGGPKIALSNEAQALNDVLIEFFDIQSFGADKGQLAAKFAEIRKAAQAMADHGYTVNTIKDYIWWFDQCKAKDGKCTPSLGFMRTTWKTAMTWLKQNPRIDSSPDTAGAFASGQMATFEPVEVSGEQALWNRIIETVAMAPHVKKSHLAGTEALGRENGTLYVEARNSGHLEIVKNRFMGHILDAAGRVEEGLVVEFVLGE